MQKHTLAKSTDLSGFIDLDFDLNHIGAEDISSVTVAPPEPRILKMFAGFGVQEVSH